MSGAEFSDIAPLGNRTHTHTHKGHPKLFASDRRRARGRSIPLNMCILLPKFNFIASHIQLLGTGDHQIAAKIIQCMCKWFFFRLSGKQNPVHCTQGSLIVSQKQMPFGWVGRNPLCVCVCVCVPHPNVSNTSFFSRLGIKPLEIAPCLTIQTGMIAHTRGRT